ncbi:serine/threonine-protein phosphatase 6 regulatory ankyrin repeat subunit A [Apiospora arundinis]|uniref:Serine/threonine-protein phosphatase 6 regulatory ankyrin repeat subunit A n=1 Tax=Apiospora arundinis TaxID=335852 RepID=A0ABR2JMS4_9PEZI
MSGIHELPWELMLQVLDNIDDDNDWASLARVRTDFYDIATDKIWNKVRSPNDLKKRCMIFLMACATGSTRAVHRLFEMGLNPNFYYLHYSDKNDVLPDQNVFPHTLQLPPGNYGFWQPLHVAAHHGQKQIVDILLQKGVWVDAPSRGYSPIDRPWKGDMRQGKHTPLHLAMCEGHEEIAKLLITEGHGAAINEPDEYGCSPLMYAYHFNQDVFLRFLLDQGASSRVEENEAYFGFSHAPSLLHKACWDHQVLRKLLIPPENPHDSQPEGKWEECDWMDRHYYKIYWCLKERIKIHSDSGRSIVTIRSRRIEWPKEFEGPVDSEEYAEEMHGVFERLRVPWDCKCCKMEWMST